MGPPQFSMWMFVSSFLPFVVSWFWRTFGAAGCVPSVMSQPQKQDCRRRQRVDLARPFLVSPAIKIELKTASKWPCPKRKSGSAWQSHFWQCGTCSKHEALYITQVNQSWVLFKQQAFNATEGAPLRGPESTTASTAKSDVALAHFLPGFSMSNNPAIVGTCSSIFMFVLERD